MGRLSQDTLPSPLPIASLSKCYYTHCTTSDVYTTPVSTTVNTVITIAFSNTVRAERREDRHRMTPTGVLRHAVNGVWLEKDAALPVSAGTFVFAVQPYMGGVARIVGRRPPARARSTNTLCPPAIPNAVIAAVVGGSQRVNPPSMRKTCS